MSGNDSSATATLTPTNVAVVSAVTSAGEEEEEEDPATLTLDRVEPSGDVDLVNGPNPWLPAYGFQLQHHSQFQPTHLEDLRVNDTVLVQQVDFLETILEETSDDLQSDSDCSGTTYWLGSDSETESVIHIKTKQKSTDERLDGSGSECNSVVPKKRRRRDHGTDHHHHHHHHHQQVTTYDEYPTSPRSSRSTASSRSSSLLQFESLERTCATLSPSSYSFDSLEYSNRSNTSHPENDSPDSLEQDYDRLLPNGFASTLADHFPRIRPYRSFESLDTCQKDDVYGQAAISNGFAPLYAKRGADLSNIRKNNQRPRDFWHEDEEYDDDDDDDDDDDEEEDDEYDFEEYERSRTNADSRLMTDYEDRLLYGESGKYATSLDYRNTIDLREIGVETKRDTLLELKSGQKTARLNIAGGSAEHHHHHHHHHHHQHPQQQRQQQQQQYQQQQYDQHDHHHHHHHRRRRQQQHQGWSDEERFNFRFTDKSQSAPSLLDGVEESARNGLSCTLSSRLHTSRTTSYVSTSSLFENYTRVASVPVDLNLCGVVATCDDEMNGREMAEITPNDEAATLKNSQDDTILKENDDEMQAETKVVLSSVRTQPAQGALMDDNLENHRKKNEEQTKVECANDRREVQQTDGNKQAKPPSTVKTQDRSNCVLDMAMVTENDLDEAIKQFKREVEEATASGVANAAILAMETIQRTPSGRVRNRRVKNNASYELAQQLEVDERNFQRILKDTDENRDGANSPGKRRVLNNASYELAQQCSYIKALENSRSAFHRMDACDELEEAASGRSSGLKIADVMHQMDFDTNISEDSRPKDSQDDSFFGQIKKNSDPFSVCGDASALSPRLLDDEVDYPCLETKSIGASCLENRVVLRENIESEKSTQLKSVLENSSAVSSYIDEESSSKRSEEETGDAKKSFIGEFYPERVAQLSRRSPQADEDKIQERKVNSENVSSNREHEDRSHSPSPSDRDAGERLWRVVIEKQATAKNEKKEEEKRDEVEAVEKKEVEEEGHNVRGVGSESPPGDPGLLGSSGKPAVAVAAVDTNHRGGDRDKRQGDEQQRAPCINKRDASVANAKRSSFVAPKRESTKIHATSSTSLPTSSAAMKSEERKKSGLGGFLQRFSRLRFSGRTKVPRSEAHKKAVEPTTRTQEEQQPATAKKKEPDYIIIPLHPPEEERRRQQEAVTLEEAARRNNVDIQRSVSSVSSNG
ncbi:lateral signaling target protein 2 homolog, partial [Pogonomyrmex barbatus]|uniref:Lateral signaling target protein 2 homolog n=1 Tax=Pogonomyrmex barbatus TaxID=144034 RepID=A0A8N1SBZ0_9HYME